MMFWKIYACLNCGKVFGGEKRSKKKMGRRGGETCEY